VIFGEVIAGMSVVDAIAEGKVEENDFGEKSVPVDPVMIESVDIITE
jgi:cyclophilin family peptidyl-prolyl cis-trans isomerase